MVLPADERTALVYAPDADDQLWVAVHPDALKSGARNTLTQVLGIGPDDEISWVGAVDEAMLQRRDGQRPHLRRLLRDRILVGPRQWSVIRIRSLVVGDPWLPYLTVYSGTRPWLVLGELANGCLLAAPLNDARSNPKWYTPVVQMGEARFRGSTKDSQIELAHLWSFAPTCQSIGDIAPAAREEVGEAVWSYFSAE